MNNDYQYQVQDSAMNNNYYYQEMCNNNINNNYEYNNLITNSEGYTLYEKSESVSDRLYTNSFKDQKKWTREEDLKLIHLFNNYQIKNWKKISQIIKSKSPQQCSYRFQKLSSKTYKSNWNHKDDISLVELIEIYGNDWEKIAERLKKPIETIQERYNNKLNPKLKRSKFTVEEDEKVIELHHKFGNNWTEIAKYLPDRNALMIKNRFYSVLRKKILNNKVNSKDILNDESLNKNLSDIKNYTKDDNKSTVTTKNLSSNNPENTVYLNDLQNSFNCLKRVEEGEEDQLKIEEICNYRYEKDFVDLDMYFGMHTEKEIYPHLHFEDKKEFSDFPQNLKDNILGLPDSSELRKDESTKDLLDQMLFNETKSSQEKDADSSPRNEEVSIQFDLKYKHLLQDLVNLKNNTVIDYKDSKKCREYLLQESKIISDLITVIHDKINYVD
jgi:hypothetical protein